MGRPKIEYILKNDTQFEFWSEPMKWLLVALSLVFTVLCGSAIANDQEALQKSLRKWENSRLQTGGDYSYQVSFSSFAGFGHVTEIIVQDNKVVERRYREFNRREPQPVPPGDGPAYKWVEKGKELGSHKEGAAVKTVDELYQEAAMVLKRDLPEHEKRYLTFDKQGLLKSCFTVDTRIADDAPTKGVLIAGITLVYKAPNGKPFPAHWGEPPRIQTRDLRPLPGGYGRGSGTLAGWIDGNLKRDAAKRGR